MPRSETVLSVFLVSPSDVAAERKSFGEIVSELNSTWSKRLGIRFEILNWEKSVHPSVGKHAQSVINEQIGEDYDVIVALFWGRIGSPTLEHVSGTVEELSRALKRHKRGESVEIMVYFKDAPIAPSAMDAGQLSKLRGLQDQLKEQGCLFYQFTDSSGFESMIRNHLSLFAQRFMASPSVTKANHASTVDEPSAEIEILSDVEREDFGLLDYMELSEQQFEIMNRSMVAIGEATSIITEKLGKRTDQINEAKLSSSGLDRARARNILRRTGEDFDQYSNETERQLQAFSQARITAFDSLSHLISLRVEFSSQDASLDFQTLRFQLSGILENVSPALVSIVGFRDSIEALPRLSVEINRSTKRTVNVLDQVIAEMAATRQSAEEVKRVIEQIGS